MADANKIKEEETAVFENVLKEIDTSAEELNQVTDAIRLKVKVLCGRVERKFDTKKDNSAEMNAFRKQLEKEGMKVRAAPDGTVIGEGTLVSRLKKTGIEYTMKKSFHREYDDEGHYSTRYSLGFGKVEGEWQFYCDWDNDYDPEEINGKQTLDSVKRDFLPKILLMLPEFLKEYSEKLKVVKADMEKDFLPAAEISSRIAKSLES